MRKGGSGMFQAARLNLGAGRCWSAKPVASTAANTIRIMRALYRAGRTNPPVRVFRARPWLEPGLADDLPEARTRPGAQHPDAEQPRADPDREPRREDQHGEAADDLPP